MKTVIEMAREAGLISLHEPNEKWIKEFSHFAVLVTDQANARANTSWALVCKKMVAFEREACAKVAEEHMRECEGASFGIGAAIRARGNT